MSGQPCGTEHPPGWAWILPLRESRMLLPNLQVQEDPLAGSEPAIPVRWFQEEASCPVADTRERPALALAGKHPGQESSAGAHRTTLPYLVPLLEPSSAVAHRAALLRIADGS